MQPGNLLLLTEQTQRCRVGDGAGVLSLALGGRLHAVFVRHATPNLNVWFVVVAMTGKNYDVGQPECDYEVMTIVVEWRDTRKLCANIRCRCER